MVLSIFCEIGIIGTIDFLRMLSITIHLRDNVHKDWYYRLVLLVLLALTIFCEEGHFSVKMFSRFGNGGLFHALVSSINFLWRRITFINFLWRAIMIEIMCRPLKFSVFSVKQPIYHYIIKILSFLIHKSYIEEVIDWFSDPNRSGLDVLVKEAKLFFFFDRCFIRASCEPSCLWWLCGRDAPLAALTLVTLVTLVAL